MTMISRRGLLVGLLAGAATPLWAEAPRVSILPPRRGGDGTPRKIVKSSDALVGAAGLSGQVGYMLADALTGQRIEGAHEALELPPASVLKTITALYALAHLGEQFRFETQILATGPVVAGKVQGDVILLGGGDPTLDADMLGDMAAQLATMGLTGVSGRFLAYAGAIPQLGLIAADQPDYVGYNPALGGLNLNYNRVNFEWKRANTGYTLTMDARGERFIPKVRMASVKVVQRDAPLFTYAGGAGGEQWTVAATALGKGGGRWLPVRQPALYTAEVFQTLCAAQGITLPDAQMVATPPQGIVLQRHYSAPLPDVLRDMLKYSTNLTAEVVGLTASKAPDLASSGAMMTQWAQRVLGLQGHFVDHSGLGAASRITAGDLVKALLWAKDGALPAILKNVGVHDDKGKVIKGHPAQVVAKTGTLNFASALAGYIQPVGGRRLVFAIFTADVPRRDALTLSEREDPVGGAAWIKRSRILQGKLVRNWAESPA